MNRRTARLVNAVGYRTRLDEALPDMKAELLSLLEEGQELRTRRWVIRREGHSVVVSANTFGTPYELVPLPFETSQKGSAPQRI